jgi:hypothetical protein
MFDPDQPFGGTAYWPSGVPGDKNEQAAAGAKTIESKQRHHPVFVKTPRIALMLSVFSATSLNREGADLFAYNSRRKE